VAIVGPSGSGKTTLMNLIGALDRPDSGTITLGDMVITESNEKELTRYRNQKIGFVFQQHHLLPQLSLLENVLLPTLANSGSSGKEAKERSIQLIRRVGLEEVAHQKPSELSGGECQRTAVVRALINQPLILLADEPTGALDHQSAFNLVDLLIELNKEQNITLILVTHSVEVAGKMDRIFEMTEGKLVELKR
jgi:ABC-type lipoprotein export system ATPase subunit